MTGSGPGRGQEGAALVIGLVVLTSFALVIGSLMSLGGSSLVASSALRSQRSEIYGVEAAVDEAITRIRAVGSSACEGAYKAPRYALPKASPVSVTVGCTRPGGGAARLVLWAYVGDELEAEVAFDPTTGRVLSWDSNHEDCSQASVEKGAEERNRRCGV